MAPGSGPGANAYRQGQERRKKFLTNLKANGGNIDAAINATNVERGTYLKWRQRFRHFAAEVDAVRVDGLTPLKKRPRKDETMLGFGTFRKEYFGHDNPMHHLLMVDALETAKPGSITLINIFPESGKTTTLEDYACMKLAYEPETRITVGSEAQQHGRKILRRVKQRMDPHGPSRDYVRMFGPFLPPQSGQKEQPQPWGADFFDVYKRKEHDERDYSMVALGFGSAIAGTRTDLLIGDDLISRRNVTQSEKLLEDFRQDWLTRPGEDGITVLIGTRVEVGDFYELLLEADIIDRYIKLPPIITNDQGEQVSIWPEKWPLDKLANMRRKVGDDAWARNYMQMPAARGDATFTQETVDACKNPLLSILHDPGPEAIIYLGLDPGFGVNAIVAGENDWQRNKLVIRDVRVDKGLSRTEQIFQRLEDVVLKLKRPNGGVTDVVIEAMAFQKGLIEDERLQELQRTHGFRVRPHMTGVNKYDENIGIPSMALSFVRQEVELPWAPDDATRSRISDLQRELLSWRPHIRGTKLRQDLVMALWFLWIHWRNQRVVGITSPDAFRSKGSPFQLTKSGLAVVKGTESRSRVLTG